MADLTSHRTEPEFDDPVECRRCGTIRDRAVYAQCPTDGEDLWEPADPLGGTIPPRPPPPPRPPVSSPAPPTAMDRGPGRTPPRDGHLLRLRVGGITAELVSGQRLALGRDESYPTADMFARYTNVSRFHAVLRFDSGRVYIEDTASANGTFVNGQRLATGTEYEIRPGQRLRLAADVPVEIEWER